MTEASEQEKASSKIDHWRERIEDQERSGTSVRQFCKEHELAEHCFYAWRRRLREQGLVRFALVERGSTRQEPVPDAGLELLLTTGERLRIGTGVDATTLRTVLEALRA
jgi:transposase-like protein